MRMLVSHGAEIITDIKHAGTPFRSVLALVLLAAVAAGCFSLGIWQLDRAAQRDALQNAIERGRGQAPIVLSGMNRPADLVPWRPATATGRWSARHTVLLENRNLDGRPGYWVATPLLLETSEGTPVANDAPAVLVLRGWLPRDMQSAQNLPTIPTEDGLVQITGELHSHVPRIFELWQWAGGNASQLPGSLPLPDGAIPTVQNLDLDQLAGAAKLRLLPIVLAQTQDSRPLSIDAPPTASPSKGSSSVPPSSEGSATVAAPSPAASSPLSPSNRLTTLLKREWPGPSVDSDQNRGYALQWFSFSAIAFIAGLLVLRSMLRHVHRSSRKDSP